MNSKHLDEFIPIKAILLGDDQERTYRQKWAGHADFYGQEWPIVLVCASRDSWEEEFLLYHNGQAWESVGADRCREFIAMPGYPALTQERLERAA